MDGWLESFAAEKTQEMQAEDAFNEVTWLLLTEARQVFEERAKGEELATWPEDIIPLDMRACGGGAQKCAEEFVETFLIAREGQPFTHEELVWRLANLWMDGMATGWVARGIYERDTDNAREGG